MKQSTSRHRDGFRAVVVAALLVPWSWGAWAQEGFVETFDDAGFRERWFVSNHDQGGERFLTAWRRSMAEVVLPAVETPGGGALRLRLEPATGQIVKPFVSAELQRSGAHGPGVYEAYMRPARGEGLVTGFFTYTGPYFGDPHDEIDFEFLGRDTTGVWINRFVDGERMPGTFVPLGFDAAARPHLYRFEWRDDSITWSVDGRELHRITAETHAIPETPGKLFVHLWAANRGQDAWAGTPADDTVADALVHCISYRPWGEPGPGCGDYVDRGPS